MVLALRQGGGAPIQLVFPEQWKHFKIFLSTTLVVREPATVVVLLVQLCLSLSGVEILAKVNEHKVVSLISLDLSLY